ncbi:MAG: sulfatase [Anaerolineae bacterium]|nr:sulfatase [Anaerolineae bacterium]
MAQEDTRPNVIWIFGDQHRAQATGYMGDPNVHTPNLDRLAVEGLAFTRAVSGFPLCCPFRGSMLTGRYPHHCVPGHEYQMPPDQPTLATVFNEAGYRTSYFGKWHLDGFHERKGRAGLHIIPPERRGDFEEWIGYENNNSQWDCWVHGGAGDDAFQYRLPGYETDALTDLFIDFLDARGAEQLEAHYTDLVARPFFAVLSVQPPHDPYVAPAEWMTHHTPGTVTLRPNVPNVPRVVEQARRELAGYYAQIENLDWNLGRIREALARNGLAENTHIIIFSDHGDMHGSHGQFRKTSPWEEAIRIPFIIGGHTPRYANKGGSVTAPLNHVDIAPTTLGLCGIDAPAWMEGTDYSGYRIRDREVAHEPDSAYLQLVIPTMHGDSVDRPWRGVVTRDGWKYVVLEGQPWLMFNLNEDPYEQVNLAHNTRFVRERRALHARLAQWVAETGDAFALPDE